MALSLDKTSKELIEDRRFHREEIHTYMWEPSPRLRGHPLEVNFLGFRSNTYLLQRAGWLIAESTDHSCGRMRLAIKHPQHPLYGMSGPVSRSEVYYQVHRDMRSALMGVRSEVVIELHIAQEIQIQTVTYGGGLEFDPQAFVPVDCRPAYETGPGFLMSDATYFRPIEGGKEIFLKEATMGEILDIALRKQEPEQDRIRAARAMDQKREEYRRGGKLAAKLISV